jgi:hypothetical protein
MAERPPNRTYHPRDFEPWKVRASRHLIRQKWLTVRADECVTSEGAVIAPFFVLEYPTGFRSLLSTQTITLSSSSNIGTGSA